MKRYISVTQRKTGYAVNLSGSWSWHRTMKAANERYHASKLPRTHKQVLDLDPMKRTECLCWQCTEGFTALQRLRFQLELVADHIN